MTRTAHDPVTTPLHDPTHHDDPAQLVAGRLDGRTVAVAESCTAGRIGVALADVERASEFLRGGLTAYQEEVKRTLLGVRAVTVLCEQAAAEMARGIAELMSADVAIATTGVAGAEPVDGVTPGTVFVATRVDRETRATTLHLQGGDAEEICDRAAQRALELLAEHLAGREP